MAGVKHEETFLSFEFEEGSQNPAEKTEKCEASLKLSCLSWLQIIPEMIFELDYEG